jgi:3',5'-cyclic AMP phosphodiesterase CpdA
VSNGFPPFLLAHLSDLHATDASPGRIADLLGKRGLGWLSWRRRRRHEHRDFVLDALLDDLPGRGVAHVAIPGDLTHIGLPGEIEAAAGWLERIGPPDRVSLVPGNHDAYGPSRASDPFAAWAPYMRSIDAGGLGLGPEPFPYARRLGPIAIVGASTARQTAFWLATGRLGAAQLRHVEAALTGLGAEGRFRVLLLHHPPVPAGQARRRQLDDAAALRAVLARAGAELVLHGHTHRTALGRVPGPSGPIPVVGVPSASSVGSSEARRARYHVYRIEADPARRFRVSYEVRGFDPAARRFVHEADATL